MTEQGKLFIAVAGNIGSGKTTLTNKLSKTFDCIPHYESVEDNPYLEDFYQDMGKYSFPLQIYFLNHRFQAHRHIEKNGLRAVQDRSIYEDAHIFAKNLFHQGLMTERDFENYFTLFQHMTSVISPPDVMIFLKRSVPKLMERIALRGRDFESKISVDYISQLNDLYANWYATYNRGKFLLVDTDDIDLLNSENDYNELVSQVNSVISSSHEIYL